VDFIQWISFAERYIEEGDLNRIEMTAKLLFTLETAIYIAMQKDNILQ